MEFSDKESTTTKEELPSFLLEATWYSDSKVIELELDFGEIFLARFLKLVGLARRQEGYVLDKTKLRIYAYELRLSDNDFQTLLSALLKTNLLIERDSDYAFPGLLRRMEAFEEGRAKRRAAAMRRWKSDDKPQETKIIEEVESKTKEQSILKESESENALEMQSICNAHAMHMQSNACLNTNTNTNTNTKEFFLLGTKIQIPTGGDCKGGDPPVAQVPEVPPIEEFNGTDPPENEFERMALERLEEPKEQDWVRDARYVGAGRRPMKKYPDLFLTPGELAQLFQQWSASKIPRSRWKEQFLKVQSRIQQLKIEGKNPVRVSAFNWLSGWCPEETLRQEVSQTIRDKHAGALNQ